MKSKDSVLRHPLWSNIFGGLAVAGLLAVGGYMLDWWPYVRDATGAAWGWLGKKTEMPNWILCLLAIPAAGALALIGMTIWFKINPWATRAAGPQWTDFTEDHIFGLVWRWNYLAGRISQLVSFCPHCDYQVYPADASAYTAVDRISFTCESCGRQLGTFEESAPYLESRVERTIQQRLRNDDWKAVVAKKNDKLSREQKN